MARVLSDVDFVLRARELSDGGMNQRNIAKELGCSQAMISLLLRGVAGVPAALKCEECAAPLIEPAAKCGFCLADDERGDRLRSVGVCSHCDQLLQLDAKNLIAVCPCGKTRIPRAMFEATP